MTPSETIPFATSLNGITEKTRRQIVDAYKSYGYSIALPIVKGLRKAIRKVRRILEVSNIYTDIRQGLELSRREDRLENEFPGRLD